MASTTIKVSTETRDRLKELPGSTLEESIVDLLDHAEESEFWARADRAAEWRRSLAPQRRAELEQRDADVVADFDRIR